MPLSEDDIREILRLIDESDVEVLRIETEELSLHVVRGEAEPREARDEAAPAAEAVHPPPARAGEAEIPVDGVVAAATGGVHTISSPMLGTFYRAPAPGASPFVDVGMRVEPNTVVCLIEVMKMMNSVPAGVAGTIVEVCAPNGELVEHGAALFRVRADR
jgi:acetyl-CoA carboxylase biotin carboxyl carrier protein